MWVVFELCAEVYPLAAQEMYIFSSNPSVSYQSTSTIPAKRAEQETLEFLKEAEVAKIVLTRPKAVCLKVPTGAGIIYVRQ